MVTMRSFLATPASAVMADDVVVLQADDTIGRARDLILGVVVGALPVVDDRGHLVGILSSWDLVDDWSDTESVTTVMSGTPRTIASTTPVSEMAHMMSREGIHHLVVIEGRRPIGMVSTLDLVDLIARQGR